LGHSITKHVRGFHCDAYGHVNNARYLEFFEEARWQALSDSDLINTFNHLGLQFFIVNINIDFKKPVMPEAVMEINTSLGAFKRKTMSFIQTISVDGQVTTQAEVTFVLFDSAAQSATSLTEEIEQLFKSFKNAKS
jgi:thioesterase-3